MTAATKATSIKPGDQIHILATGVTLSIGDFYPSYIGRRGDTLTVTEAMIDASRDRNGETWLAAVATGDDPRIGLGPFPSDLPVLLSGSLEFEAERQRRRDQAWLIPTESEREAALAKVRKEFGAPIRTGSSISFDSRS
ncbi:hypothetical protein B7R54_00970 [Subtercola boreus]|uniref:Uncharacterized protein n=1 Tax=Subtercola boreus TaxID=120213 RepID=A0A3E0VDX0_9MICO|nr:hypothetical protein [Subtercola boreus]RFA07941.1 hypothetical protein B7R54_00970 [Subtercola boreus]TQL55196.1 hypothetical protein FB464_2754 [Subtercola boreus]